MGARAGERVALRCDGGLRMSDTCAFAPVAAHRFAPAVLPVFDDSWKTKCQSCAHYRYGRRKQLGASMICAARGATIYRRQGAEASCGEARSTRGLCGPDAKLWEGVA